MKKILPIIAALTISLGLTLLNLPGVRLVISGTDVLTKQEIANALIKQEITGTTTAGRNITKVYDGGLLVGILTNPEVIDQLLNDVYQNTYSIDFPNSILGLGEDIFLVTEPSYYVYSDVDKEIVDYLRMNDRFSIEVHRIEFSNGAIIYVNSMDDFQKARDQYLLNFISREAYTNLRNNVEQPELRDYGYREISIDVLESITFSRGLASRNDILKNVNEIVYFLSYGYGTEIKKYTVVPYDTVAGVASKNGLSAQQVLSINSDILRSENQILEVGMELNVTYFNSPINVVVTRERLVAEPVYPQSTLYIPDSTIREGLSRVQTREELGSKDVKYLETYVNGVLVRGDVMSSTVTKQPVREVIRYGTLIIPGIGSGTFRWPVNNPRITCRWYCYAGHTAIDIADRYNRFGNVYAADRGVVVERGYNRVSGYYIRINHNNGYMTQYGHFASQAYFPVGVAVNKGELIGRIGMTGVTTGPHVHFVVWLNGVRINPCRVLNC